MIIAVLLLGLAYYCFRARFWFGVVLAPALAGLRIYLGVRALSGSEISATVETAALAVSFAGPVIAWVVARWQASQSVDTDAASKIRDAGAVFAIVLVIDVLLLGLSWVLG